MLKISTHSYSHNINEIRAVREVGGDKEARIYNGLKTVSLTSGAGQPLVKE